MKKYDGWVVKSFFGRNSWFMEETFYPTRKEVIKHFEERIFGKGEWRKFRRRGDFKIVKVKFVEAE